MSNELLEKITNKLITEKEDNKTTNNIIYNIELERVENTLNNLNNLNNTSKNISKELLEKYLCTSCKMLSSQISNCNFCKSVYCSECINTLKKISNNNLSNTNNIPNNNLIILNNNEESQIICSHCKNLFAPILAKSLDCEELGKVEVKCKYDECDFVTNLINLNEHETNCNKKPLICGKCLKNYPKTELINYEEHMKSCNIENYFVYEEKLKAIKNTYTKSIEEYKSKIESEKHEIDLKITEYEKIYDLQKKDIMNIIKTSGLKNNIDQKLLNFVFYPDCKGIYYCIGKKNGCNKKKNVWGNNPYTFDSEICRAALNSGFISEDGGVFEVTKGDFLESFQACDRNGVSTLNYGRSTQIKFSSPDPDLLDLIDTGDFEDDLYNLNINPNNPNDPNRNKYKFKYCGKLLGCCRGKNNGCLNFGAYIDAWGENPYSGDSNMCNAALNAGAITKSGGVFFVEEMGPRENFKSTYRNDIRTLNWGFFENSFMIKKF